ncbi:MAG: hypothetical protein ACPGSM_11945 [Thiolinea sp.]
MKNITKLLATTALLMGFSSACAAWADSNSSEVRLVATIDNSPAFKAVNWEIYRVDDPSTRYERERRHSFTLKSVTPGRYRAIVRRNGTVHKRDFYVMADTTSKINVPVD